MIKVSGLFLFFLKNKKQNPYEVAEYVEKSKSKYIRQMYICSIKFRPLLIIDLKYSCAKCLTKCFKVLHEYVLNSQWRPFLINYRYWFHLKVNIFSFTVTIELEMRDAHTPYTLYTHTYHIKTIRFSVLHSLLYSTNSGHTFVCFIFRKQFMQPFKLLNCYLLYTDCDEKPSRLLCHTKNITFTHTVIVIDFLFFDDHGHDWFCLLLHTLKQWYNPIVRFVMQFSI